MDRRDAAAVEVRNAAQYVREANQAVRDADQAAITAQIHYRAAVDEYRAAWDDWTIGIDKPEPGDHLEMVGLHELIAHLKEGHGWPGGKPPIGLKALHEDYHRCEVETEAERW